METAKVRVKFGNLEVEYEGDQNFVSDGLLTLISDVVDLSKQIPSGTDALGKLLTPPSNLAPTNGTPQGNGTLTIGTIAAHLSPSGPQELAMCALAKLQIVDGKLTVDGGEIKEEMRSAASYYNSSMSRNFARDLNRMVKGKKINEVSKGVYALTAASRQELEPKIAGIG
jgi:hypothetical protein